MVYDFLLIVVLTVTYILVGSVVGAFYYKLLPPLNLKVSNDSFQTTHSDNTYVSTAKCIYSRASAFAGELVSCGYRLPGRLLHVGREMRVRPDRIQNGESRATPSFGEGDVIGQQSEDSPVSHQKFHRPRAQADLTRQQALARGVVPPPAAGVTTVEDAMHAFNCEVSLSPELQSLLPGGRLAAPSAGGYTAEVRCSICLTAVLGCTGALGLWNRKSRGGFA